MTRAQELVINAMLLSLSMREKGFAVAELRRTRPNPTTSQEDIDRAIDMVVIGEIMDR